MRILGKRVVEKEFREIFTSELISVSGGLLAGFLLLALIQRLEMLLGLLILLPGFLETQGNVLGSLAGRLSVLLHLKKIRPRWEMNKLLHINVLATFVLALVVSVCLGLVAAGLNYVVFDVWSPALLYVAVIASVIAIVVGLPMTIFGTFWLYRHKYDPDDIMGPYVTTLGDIMSIVALLVAVMVVI